MSGLYNSAKDKEFTMIDNLRVIWIIKLYFFLKTKCNNLKLNAITTERERSIFYKTTSTFQGSQILT